MVKRFKIRIIKSKLYLKVDKQTLKFLKINLLVKLKIHIQKKILVKILEKNLSMLLN